MSREDVELFRAVVEEFRDASSGSNWEQSLASMSEAIDPEIECGRATSRTTSSLMSVGTSDEHFGHPIQSALAGSSAPTRRSKRRSSSERRDGNAVR